MTTEMLTVTQRTERDDDVVHRVDERRVPGLVVVFTGDAPALAPYRVDGEGVTLGRELLDRDDRLSRRHARVRLLDGAFGVSDLGSRNGTFVGGQRVTDEVWVHAPAIVRAGRSLALLVDDVRRFADARVITTEDAIIGPTLGDSWTRIQRAARAGDPLLLTGESGTGKELAARAFHEATQRKGPLVAINCAAIPAGVAERLLFGTRRGAYSGADVDADGYLVTADGGTIFLDEIGELDPAVQAKLLRVLETRDVLPLGSAKPRQVDIRVVSATLRDLRGEVAARRFREDLYHRIGRPEVRLAPLRERREDIPWLVARAAGDLALHPSLVEACLVRPWPGNTRELLAEIRRAALAAREDGRTEVRAEDLDELAGFTVTGTSTEPGTSPPPAHVPAPLPDADTISRALAAENGNVSRAARALGLHRNQLRRFLARQERDRGD